jgi:hypothetical protein
MESQESRFVRWTAELEERHLADLRFAEVSRALRALSSAYVERRERLGQGAALSGAGKRAAFALFYAPIHFLLIRHIVESIADLRRGADLLCDLGCGTGASGAAWARGCDRMPQVVGVDRHPWALDEARRTYEAFGVRARLRRGDLVRLGLPSRSAVLAAYALNELEEGSRSAMLARLLEHAGRGNRVLAVEPLARSIAPWWNSWADAFSAAGGRADEWRVRLPLPPLVQKLDRAAGLDHRELTARTVIY